MQVVRGAEWRPRGAGLILGSGRLAGWGVAPIEPDRERNERSDRNPHSLLHISIADLPHARDIGAGCRRVEPPTVTAGSSRLPLRVALLPQRNRRFAGNPEERPAFDQPHALAYGRCRLRANLNGGSSSGRWPAGHRPTRRAQRARIRRSSRGHSSVRPSCSLCQTVTTCGNICRAKDSARWLCVPCLGRRSQPEARARLSRRTLVVKWDLDNWQPMKGQASARLVRLLTELVEEGRL